MQAGVFTAGINLLRTLDLIPARKVLKEAEGGREKQGQIRYFANSRRYQEADRAEEAPLPQGVPEVRIEERPCGNEVQEVPRFGPTLEE